ncbi:TonB-dependent receptor plug domain-containing protein [Pectinatus haikarae]|uniref:Outer membrane receptor for ferrienterochelin and colicins n=1 Tax=Pectinatus haikarae TaxID=349096 RepID=A0ABT9Y5K0_9FIRM|nr:TonB-dependent receptor [Pectinatus haikarae]MDQ0202989.1 outer membrane receptor for ferrienterochelin and colicins [Pectinatus haikarae]
MTRYFKLKKKKSSIVLTLSILAYLSVPVYAADTSNSNIYDNDTIKTRDIVVTATRTKEEVKAVPNTVEIITRDDIKRLGADTVTSALRLASNINISTAGMTSGGNTVMIRGMSSNHTLILVNGIRTAGEDTTETQNLYELDRINIADVDRIEIVRGAASAQYGSDAIGGVINIITRKSEKRSTTIGAATGTNNISNWYHIDMGKDGKFSGTLDARFDKVRKQQLPAVTGSTSSTTNMYGPKQYFNFDGIYDLGNTKKLDFNVGYVKEDMRIDQGSGGTNSKTTYDFNKTNLNLIYSGKTKRGDYSLTAYYSKLEKNYDVYKDILNKSFNLSAFDSMTYEMLGLEGKNTMQLSDHHLFTIGSDMRQVSVRSTRLGDNGNDVSTVTRTGLVGNSRTGYSLGAITDNISEKNVDTYSGYLQDEWIINNKLLLISSLRYDHDNSFGSNVTPKIGATYQLSKDSRFKVNYGRGYKAPTVSELYMDYIDSGAAAAGVNVMIYGNPDLKPEKSTNFDFSFEAEKDNNFGKLTYFKNKVSNLIDYETTSEFTNGAYYNYAKYINIHKANINGVELEVGRKLNDKFTTKITSNWLNATNGDTGARLKNRARNTTTLQLVYDDHDDKGYSAVLWNEWRNKYYYASAASTVAYSSSSESRASAKDYSYSTLNLTVNKKLGKGSRVYVGIDNMLDKHVDDLYINGRVWTMGAEFTF